MSQLRPQDRASVNLQLHAPLRPLWNCRGCGAVWPCADARLLMVNQYRDATATMCIYLSGMFHEAVRDLYRLNPYDAPEPKALFDRFFGWVSKRTST